MITGLLVAYQRTDSERLDRRITEAQMENAR